MQRPKKPAAPVERNAEGRSTVASDQSDEDNIVLDTTRRIFADLADPQTPVAVDGGWKKALWPALEEAGLTLAWASEDSGGVGASLRDGFSILRINGQYAAPAPLAETLLAAWALSQAGLSCPSGPMTSAMLRPSDTLTLGGETFGVTHCPGHTPGHVVIYHETGQLAFVGDVLFRGSIGRTDFPKGNHQQLIDSIVQNLWPLGDGMRFVPGHGPMSTFGQERKDNPFVADAVLG